jgi:multidrug efflux pump subunit AcrA (membrane-fusion protein)
MSFYLLKENEKIESFDLVKSPDSYRRLAQVLVALLFSTILLLIFIPWQQTAVGYGKVLAYSPNERKQEIDAPVEGRIAQWHVHEGSVVQAGDPIVEITDNDPEILNRLKQEKEALQSRLEAAQLSARTAKLNVDRQKALVEKGLSSQRALELSRLEYAKFKTDEANSQVELARIEVRLSRQSKQSVTSPMSGTILKRIAGEGSVLVKAGEALATLVPSTSSRAVELWIEGKDISLIRTGDPVRLQFEGWPAIQFSGWPSVAVGTFGGKISIIDAADGGNGMFRVLIVPNDPTDSKNYEAWPSSDYLRQGIRTHGWILLGRVRLGYELWRQFNGFPPVIAPHAPS